MNLPQFYIDDLIKTALKEDFNYIDVTTDYLLNPEAVTQAYFVPRMTGSSAASRWPCGFSPCWTRR